MAGLEPFCSDGVAIVHRQADPSAVGRCALRRPVALAAAHFAGGLLFGVTPAAGRYLLDQRERADRDRLRRGLDADMARLLYRPVGSAALRIAAPSST
jgi:hypothetical protein